MVYVIGQVVKAGGFSLSEHENITVLKALSLAGGFDRAASPGKARILRPSPEPTERTEIPVDIKAILSRKAVDVAMHPEDILFIPGSTPKKVATRTAEAALQIGTGIAIFGR
jgi:polysaccharide export outer membrane protein